MAKKLYEVLGVDETASAEEIRKAYRKQALKYHPDKHSDKTEKEKKDAEAQFLYVGKAYAILGDEAKHKQYDAGHINDQGEEVRHAQDDAFKRPRQRASQTNQAHPTHQAHPTQNPFSRSNAPFFRPQPAHYFFFNSEHDAQSFRPDSVRGPHFVYVTTSPLQSLFEVINATLGQNHKPTTSRSAHTSHVAANGDSSTHHQPVDNHPEHVSVKTNYSPRIERIIDRLIGQMILLELLENLSQQYDRPHYSGPTPGF